MMNCNDFFTKTIEGELHPLRSPEASEKKVTSLLEFISQSGLDAIATQDIPRSHQQLDNGSGNFGNILFS